MPQIRQPHLLFTLTLLLPLPHRQIPLLVLIPHLSYSIPMLPLDEIPVLIVLPGIDERLTNIDVIFQTPLVKQFRVELV